jgi:mannose-6-phosphate isomerase-like protein (cupin superfamily)
LAEQPGEKAQDRPRVYGVFRGDAVSVDDSPFGAVGTLFAGSGMEVVWVSKRAEEIDPGWFVYQETDVIVVLQGRLKVEFESSAEPDRVLDPGDALVLPPGWRCRAYRWPRGAEQATVFLAAYPVRPS